MKNKITLFLLPLLLLCSLQCSFSFASSTVDLSASAWRIASTGSLSARRLLSTSYRDGVYNQNAYFGTIHLKHDFFLFNIFLRATGLEYEAIVNERLTLTTRAPNLDLFFFPIRFSIFDIGGGAKAIQAKFIQDYHSTSLNATLDYNVQLVVPMAYASVSFPLPISYRTKFNAVVLGMKKSDEANYLDVLAQAEYALVRTFSMALGYRYLSMRHKEVGTSEELYFNFRFKGPFVQAAFNL
ncbi:MAG: hypothetical protein HQK50_13450 [Oligoflexia bacterium]|nr:hypothetical protein [Oligoflexia bacterium]MBF0366572.1 hypothetical protein [Oligoflexia bacterium]